MKRYFLPLILFLISLNGFGQIYPRNYISDSKSKYELKSNVETVEIRKYNDENKFQLSNAKVLNHLFKPQENLFFNKNGNLLKDSIFSIQNNKLIPSLIINYKHNDSNQITEIERINKNGDVIGIDSYNYSKSDTIKASQNNEEYIVFIEKTKNTDIFKITKENKDYYEFKFTFSDSLVIKSEETDYKYIYIKIEYNYNPNERKPFYIIEEGKKKIYYIYNDKLDVIKQITEFKGSSTIKFFEYKYDKFDNWVEKKTLNEKKQFIELTERKITYYN